MRHTKHTYRVESPRNPQAERRRFVDAIDSIAVGIAWVLLAGLVLHAVGLLPKIVMVLDAVANTAIAFLAYLANG